MMDDVNMDMLEGMGVERVLRVLQTIDEGKFGPTRDDVARVADLFSDSPGTGVMAVDADPVTTALSTVTATYAEIQEKANKLEVTDEASEMVAAESLAILNRALKTSEEVRIAQVKPLNDKVNAINARFKEFAQKCNTLKEAVSQKVLAYRQDQEKKRLEAERVRREAEEKAAAEAEKRRKELEAELQMPVAPSMIPAAPVTEPVAPAKKPPKVKATSGSITEKKTWEFEVTDAAVVPHEFFTLDERKIRKAVDAGAREIAGVRIWEKTSIVGSR